MSQESMLLKIGHKIKTLRIENNLGQGDLSYKTGISKSIISKIENGRSVPSLPILLNIIKHLNIDLITFFKDIDLNEDRKNVILIKKTDQKPYNRENSIGFHYNYIFGGYINCEFIETNLLVLDVNSHRDRVVTDALQLDYVVKGKIKYLVDEDVFDMEEGDTLIFNGTLPHVAENLSDSEAVILGFYFYSSKPDEIESKLLKSAPQKASNLRILT